MSIFDGDKPPINLNLPTLGGKVFWDNIKTVSGYTLQRHSIEGHCRILDSENKRVAWGTESQMRARLRELTEPDRHAKYGDIIGVHRIGSIYDHYGVYESDNVVYHYAAENSDFGKATIHTTTLKKFIADSGSYFVLEFPEEYGMPGKVAMAHGGGAAAMANKVLPKYKQAFIDLLIKKKADYKLYSPSETISRAKSRLGESNYNLLTNNCEHFAIWCKTGIEESHQVKALLGFINIILINVRRIGY